jgi:hypothetical protein
MVGIALRWDNSTDKLSKITSQVDNNPIAKEILTLKRLGQTKAKIVEILLKKGYSYRHIRTAYSLIDRVQHQNKRLDWRSPTSINETARLLRNDVRKGKISYYMAMTILIRARDTLKTLVKNPAHDKRIPQINQEIITTKKLLMRQYGNPESMKNYKVIQS